VTVDAWVYGPEGVLARPTARPDAAQALTRAVDALLDDRPHPSDVRHGAAIVHALAQAERQL
jgi:hypothetical protein